MQQSRALQLVEHVLEPFSDDPILTSRVEIGDQCDVSADDLVGDRNRRLSARAKAERFLRGLLADGPHRATEVFGLAEDADISASTLRRAKRDLGVDSFQRKTPDGEPEWWWLMPEEESPPDDEPFDDDEEDE